MDDASSLLSRRIKQQAVLNAGDRILVAVSGGPDSVALLHVLHGLRDELALHLEVAHLQHGIRGEDAKADARFVGGLAAMLGLTFHLAEVDLPALRGRAGKGNLEAMARQQRYRFFCDVAQRRQLDKVATAHTADDQAETLLMWLLRGAGRQGLGAMQPSHELQDGTVGEARRCQIIRPFLGVAKAEIVAFLDQRQIAYRTDATNRDTKLLRNWIRLELLPQLRQRFDGGVGTRLAEQAALLRDEQGLLDEIVGTELGKCQQGDGLDRVRFLGQSRPLQRLIVRSWLAKKRGDLRAIGLAHVEAVRQLAASGPAQGQLALPGNWLVRREYDLLLLQPRPRGLQTICYAYPWQPPAALAIPEAGVKLIVDHFDSGNWQMPADSMEAVFDADALPTPLTVRNFRNGDRFAPIGMSGHKKIKDLYVDHKLTLSERRTQPILIGAGQILWIPGHGRSRTALVTPTSRGIIRIRVVPIGT